MQYEIRGPWSIRKGGVLPRVSLIIPAYNEEKLILRCLLNIKNLDFPKNKLEIIIVDDGSTDNTAELIEEFIRNNVEKLDAQLRRRETREGKASALNYGRQLCKGEILVLTDADTILKEDAVKKITSNFVDPTIGAVTGNLSMLNFDQCYVTRIEKTYRSIFNMLRMGESRLDSTPIFNGPLIAVRKQLLEELKIDTIADDTELALRTRERGYKAVFDPEALAYTTTPRSGKLRIKQKARRGMGIIQALIRHRRMIFNPYYNIYGLVILPAEVFMHIVSPILIALISAAFLLTLIFNFSTVSVFALAIGAIGLVLLVLSGLDFFVTFLEHQLALFLGLLYLIGRTENHQWEKIEDQ
jgi:cellulose synthase/poly-beta-1,6-N-acetylglucosamine synthase-like glycosyltransferase